jgi:hypothetical protein
MQKYEQSQNSPNSIALGAIRGLFYYLSKPNRYLAAIFQRIWVDGKIEQNH